MLSSFVVCSYLVRTVINQTNGKDGRPRDTRGEPYYCRERAQAASTGSPAAAARHKAFDRHVPPQRIFTEERGRVEAEEESETRAADGGALLCDREGKQKAVGENVPDDDDEEFGQQAGGKVPPL